MSAHALYVTAAYAATAVILTGLRSEEHTV